MPKTDKYADAPSGPPGKGKLVELVMDNDEHWYELDGTWLPSVTTILSVYPKGAGFAIWQASQGSKENADAVRDAAGRRGTNVHKAIERMLGGATLAYEDFTREEWGMLESFVTWLEDYSPEVMKTEDIVFSSVHGYAGTMDLLCKIEGEIFVVDYKTSSGIYTSHLLQGQAYAHAVIESDQPVHKTAILRLGSKHKKRYEFKVEEISDKSMSDFLAVKQIWELENPNAGPKIITIPSTLSLPR